MSQYSLTLPTTGTVSGLSMTQKTNEAIDTLATLASGASAPSSPLAGQLWHDTTNHVLKLRSQDNTTWLSLCAVQESAGVTLPSYQPYQSFANRIRNAGGSVAQRGTSGSISSGSSGYTLDGFIAGCSGAALSWTQSTGSGGAAHALLLNSATGMTDAYTRQRLESTTVQPLAGKTCTFQALVYNGTAGAMTPTLTIKHANAADDWTSSTTDISAVNLQSCTASAWTLVAYSFTAHAAGGNGLEITLGFGGALNVASKSIKTTAWDVRLTEGVTTGLYATPPLAEIRPIGLELMMAQRYYQKLGGETVSDALGSGFATSATSCQIIIPVLPTPMRAAPTMSFTAAGNFTVNTIATANAATSITPSSLASAGLITLTVGSTGMTAGDPALFRTNTASDALTFSAEL